jgi:hypothetical protein
MTPFFQIFSINPPLVILPFVAVQCSYKKRREISLKDVTSQGHFVITTGCMRPLRIQHAECKPDRHHHYRFPYHGLSAACTPFQRKEV